MKRILTSTIFLLLIFLLTGCGQPDTQGIILEVTDRHVLLSKNLTAEAYAEIKDIPAKDLQNEDVRGDRDSLNLISLTYEDIDDLGRGDLVEVWIRGAVMESYPEQATARKIVIKK